jgi:hypothetical protein
VFVFGHEKPRWLSAPSQHEPAAPRNVPNNRTREKKPQQSAVTRPP